MQAPSSKSAGSSGIGFGINRAPVKSGGLTGTATGDKVKKISASAVQKKTVDAPSSISVPGKFSKPGGAETGGGGGGGGGPK